MIGTRRRPLRWLGLAGTAIAALILTALVATAIWLHSSLPQRQGRIQIAALHGPVSIARDADGIPSIKARSEHDAYVALGFVHAQDRLWQMEATRRIGAGRLAEVIGPSLLATDKFMRTLGLHRRAEAIFDAAEEGVQQALLAYAEGVNAYIDGHGGALPPEYYLLRFRPEPWRPADSLVWGQLMGLRLAGDWRGELIRLALSRRLTPQQMAQFFDDRSPGPVTIPDARRADARPDTSVTSPVTSPVTIGDDALHALAELLPPLVGPTSASNSWVLSGGRSVSGKPLLANDPHLVLDIPSPWYLARVSAPGLEVSGATAPGVPFHILGHNARIAWGFTNTGSDVQDLFVERLDPADAGRYRTPDGPQPFHSREEIVAVRGAPPVTLIVRETRHGPVISDLLDEKPAGIAADEVLAFASVGLRNDDQTATALYALNRAGDWPQFTAALRRFHYPQQNITYADIDGNVGFYVAGRVPLRKSGDGATPVPGDNGDYDWSGFIPFEDLPHSYNPTQGWLANANNRVVGDSYPYALGRNWEEPYRAERIAQMLSGRPRFDIADMAAMQGDIESRAAVELLPLLLPALRTHTGFNQSGVAARALLDGWDGDMRADMPQPLLFNQWLLDLNHALYADELGPDYSRLARSLRPSFLRQILTRAPQWCDDITTATAENCGDQIVRAFETAVRRLAATYGDDPRRWRWAEAHQAQFSHRIFQRIPLLGDWSTITIATPGDDSTINRGTTSTRDDDAPFAHVHGPVLRAIYDLADLTHSRFIIAGGQSGNILSPFYANMIERWRDLGYLVLNDDGRETNLLLLVPKGRP